MPLAISASNLSKSYNDGTSEHQVLVNINVDFAASDTCVLLGPSGSGKTTLLSICGCLLRPTRGQLTVAGKLVQFDRPDMLTELRRRSIGFVFQQSQLLPFVTIQDNLKIVARNAGMSYTDMNRRISEVTHYLDLKKHLHRKPAELSGGQRQRVAVARAVLHRPPILLADEPTAALDWQNGQAAIRLLIEQAKRENVLLVVVTHDTRLVPLFNRVLRIESGQIVSDTVPEPLQNSAESAEMLP
ncbi:MAG: ABC transporter ATP-binding protein [Pirellulales bacterium]|nr:ABC transporter ATP-binding protein [Pirellulales bacterium]